VACVLAAATGATGATSGTVVGATVPSATQIDASTCATNTAATNFGNLLPGVSALTPGTCIVQFGSSNDTSSLRLRQTDSSGVAMWRLPTGAPDTSYGGGDGASDAATPVTSPVWNRGASWDALADDTVYVGATHGSDIRIYRLRPDGNLDTGWGGTGLVTFTQPNQGTVLAATAGDRPFVAGASGIGQLIVGRFRTDGTFDTNVDADPATHCDADGWNQFALPGGLTGAAPSSITYDATTGRTYVGIAADNGSDNDMGIAAITPTCQLDTSFSGDGWWWHDFGNYEITTDVVVDDDGDLMVFAEQGSNDVATARLDSAGAPDLTYNGTGFKAFDTAAFGEHTRAAVRDGSRVLVAVEVKLCVCDTETRILAIRDDGTLDPAYGTAGVFTIDVESSRDDEPGDVMLDAAGNLALIGTFRDGGGSGPYGARIKANGTLDTTFGYGGTGVGAYIAGRQHHYSYIHEGIDGRSLVGHRRDVDGTNDTYIIDRNTTVAVDQYLDDTRDWLTPGTGQFGVCLASTTGTAAWPTDASCTQGSDPWWRAVPTASTIVATEATAGPQTASLRFGFRTLANQPPGTYVAPITFEVIAP
jgi:uncharacterized delta-60 repeat protein